METLKQGKSINLQTTPWAVEYVILNSSKMILHVGEKSRINH